MDNTAANKANRKEYYLEGNERIRGKSTFLKE